MEYIIIMGYTGVKFEAVKSDHGFLETFASWEAAKEVAQQYKDDGYCREYVICQMLDS